MTNGALVYVFVTVLATCNCCASNTFTFEFMQSILDPREINCFFPKCCTFIYIDSCISLFEKNILKQEVKVNED